ncbi:CatB-related O-acetyltransferase [Acetobacteraceae bacterium KSS12]|uniref:CatB-related O-acetyltransferase n=2 Tax=Rhizosaccharibacter radicis TaxID=2782605 RepID=A0ABT1W0N2_9PROT|nr:CatB-related O-acetyltransferase [Acetobacteraceae bacterium KSS12]
MGSFPGYTALKLAREIELHGWEIGAGTYGMPRILEPGRGVLRIGRYCSMADPTIVLGNHRMSAVSTYPFMDLWRDWPGTTPGMRDHADGDVTIGNDVWIGVGAIILPRSVIGDGAVIGAGAVVRGTVPPYAICTGNPATVIRYRFPEPIIERLLRLGWWNWPAARIDRCLRRMLDDDVESFLLMAERENGAGKGSGSR